MSPNQTSDAPGNLQPVEPKHQPDSVLAEKENQQSPYQARGFRKIIMNFTPSYGLFSLVHETMN